MATTNKVKIASAVFTGEGWQVDATVETRNGSRSGNDYVALGADATEDELATELLVIYDGTPQ